MADTKVSALAAVTTVAGAQELPVNDAGTTKKLTVSQLLGFRMTPYAIGDLVVPTGYQITLADRIELPGSETLELQGDATAGVD